MSNHSRRSSNTSLVLLCVVFVTGVALGWLLRDITTALSSRWAASAASAGPTAVKTAQPTPIPSPVLQPAVLPTRARPAPSAAVAAPTNLPTAVTRSPTIEPAGARAPTPTAASEEAAITAYVGHVVGAGETLETIAANGGSTPDLVARYNRLAGAPQPGRALIVPQLAGQPSVLQNQPILVQRGREDRPWVALTLDAGADAAPVPRMLATLREHHVHVTFFLTGKWIAENPDLARQIVADGHEIANHTMNHPDLRRVDSDTIRKELAETEALMQATTGVGTRPFFRPPYGAYDARVLQVVQQAGYLPVYWTLDSLDSVGRPKTPQFLLERITSGLAPEQLRGAIILAHCGSAPTADALPQILDRFAAMGFQVKKVSEVLEG